MTKLTLISAVGISLSCSALAHEGHEHATGVVRERMELMTDMGQRLLAISKRLRANRDLDKISGDARAIHEMAGKIAAEFPPGSMQPPTAAKPMIWQQWDDFTEKAKSWRARLQNYQRQAPLPQMDYARSFGLSLTHAMVATKHTECQKQTADSLGFWFGVRFCLLRG